MFKIRNSTNHHFWFLILITLVLTGLGLALIGGNYSQGWAQTIWQVCQSGLQNLKQYLSLSRPLVIIVIVAAVIMRGSWSIGRQVRSTRGFVRLFLPLRTSLPARLQALLKPHGLAAEDIVYLDLPIPHAFCLGFWRPRIWLTSGLIKLLTDEELGAVLAHEAYHYQQRDPLRLLISRTLKAAFFFLPLVNDLAKSAELQQEVAADQSAIAHLGDDLPLLCALQKLLTRGTKGVSFPGATFNPFNVTEARLRRLISPAQSTPFSRQTTPANWAINLGVFIILSSIGLLSTQPVVQHREIRACVVEDVAGPLQTQLSFGPPSSRT